MGVAELLRFGRFVVSPVRGYASEVFDGEGAALLLAGNALHTDLGPEAAGSAVAVYGWLLCMLAQTVASSNTFYVVVTSTRRIVDMSGPPGGTWPGW